MYSKKVTLKHRQRNTDDEAQMQTLEDSGKTTEERNLSATSFFRRDSTYRPNHYDARNKVLSSTQSSGRRQKYLIQCRFQSQIP